MTASGRTRSIVLPRLPGSIAGFAFEQSVASALWVIDHQLGRYPALVTVVDSAGTVIYGGVSHPTANQTVLSFSTPLLGKARLV